VIYATHSPHFVGLDRIESLRVLRLESDSLHPSTAITSVDLADVASRLWTAGGKEGEPYTAETLVPRLRLLGQVPVADGFFADGVILVEGEEDRAFLLAASLEAGFDFDMGNLAVIPVGGKNNLDSPLLVFQALGVPVYTLFDGDSNVPERNRAKNQRTNRRLLAVLAAEPVDKPQTQVNDDWACYQETLERTVRQEVGSHSGENPCELPPTKLGSLRGKGRKKNPAVLLDAYQRARRQDAGSSTLDATTQAIRTKFAL
jgi:predicted ATP-dependent endonuclease of OLD family